MKNSNYVAGVDIGGTNLRVAVADGSGKIVGRWSVSTVGVRDASRILDMIRTGVESLQQQLALPTGFLRAIGAGVPGITDVDAGVVIATSYLMGWENVPFRAFLEDAFGVPAVVDNDVNVAAIGEHWIGAAAGVRDFIFIAIGTGIGAGLVLRGKPFRGTRWNAGEIGYMLVPDLPETQIEHGKPGPLESAIGGEGIKERWRCLWSKDRTRLPQELTATEIFDHAAAGDELAQLILTRSAKLLATAIQNILLILDCPLVVLGGSIGAHQAFCEATLSVLKQQNSRVIPELKRSSLGTDAQLMGAIRLALDAAEARDDS